MRLLTDIYLNLLGVGELVENAGAVLQDKLGRKRAVPQGLEGKVGRSFTPRFVAPAAPGCQLCAWMQSAI